MASFPVHFTTSSTTGAILGIASIYWLDFDWGAAVSVAVYCARGGALPDLDRDSGIPAREMCNLVSVFFPLLLYHRLEQEGLSSEQVFACMVGIYLVIRFGLKRLFRKFTVHRGMFHSVPAMLIYALVVYLTGSQTAAAEATGVNQDMRHFHRAVLGFAAGIGVLTHLVLDEIWAVNWEGLTIHLNQFAGSAVKLWSSSWPATLLTYGILAGLIYATYLDAQRFNIHPQNWLANFAPKLVPYVNSLEAKTGVQVTSGGQGTSKSAPAAVTSQPKTQTAPAQPVNRQPVPTQLIPSPSPQPAQQAPPGQLVGPSGFPAFFKPAGQ
ncbi:MAG: metal-dependent hydrolase [Gemmataceae bacterium]